jgi:tetratricopeptide (TPR) repeat protein
MARDDSDLDNCFERLARAQSEDEAQNLEAMIWRLWTASGIEMVDGLLNSGSKAMASGQFAPALALFNGIIEMTPEFAEAWNKRGTLYYLIGEYDLAVTDITCTLKLEPRHFGALSGLGMIHLQRSEKQEALRAFEDALAVHPHLSGARSAVENITKSLEQKSN